MMFRKVPKPAVAFAARRTGVALTALVALAGGLALAAPSASASAIVAPNPTANIAPSPASPVDCNQLDYNDPFSQASSYDATCQNDAIAALDNARAQMGLPAYAIPTDFTSLPVAKQLLTLVNEDRAAYKLAPYIGYNQDLNKGAQAAAKSISDPVQTPIHDWVDGQVSANKGTIHTSVMARNYAPLYAYYEWMYNDGWGSANIDCTSATSTGCWDHRQAVLEDFGSNLQVGVGLGYAQRDTAPTTTMLFQAFLLSTPVPYLPDIDSISQVGATREVTISGNGFVNVADVQADGTGVKFQVDDPHTVTARLLTGTNPTQLTVTDNNGVYNYAYDNTTGTASWDTADTSPAAAFSGLSTPDAETVSITDPGTQTGYTGAPTSLQLQATDTDSFAPITYSATNLPTGMTLDPNTGLASGTPTVATDSSHPASVTVTATDDVGSTSSTTFLWNIIKAYVTVTDPGDQATTSGQPVSLQIQAKPYGSGTLTYAATGLPGGLSIDSASGLITGTPQHAASGPVTVTATGTTGVSGNTSFAWSVTDTVTVTPPSTATGTVGTPFFGEATATDSDPTQPLTFSAVGLPAGLGIDSSTGIISGRPTVAGQATAQVTATDATGASDTQPYDLTVKPGADSTRLVATRSASPITFGRRVALKATLTDTTTNKPLPRKRLALQYRKGTRWVTLATPVTNSTGHATVMQRPRVNTTYRWRFAPQPQHKGARSNKTTVLVAQRVSLAVRSTTVPPGRKVVAWGTVAPRENGKEVYVYTLSGGVWMPTSWSAKISYQRLPNGVSGSGYVVRFKPNMPRTTFRIYRPRTPVNALGYSPTRTVRR